MKLVRIETHNFKKLRHFTATFTDGLNIIVGDNAQGKSTLLQAIECALYGASVVPGKADKIPTWGQTTWKIVLKFGTGDDVYTLTRSKTTAKLERESYDDPGVTTLVANGHTPVTKAIEELLDLSAKDYNLFMQSKQGETSGVLTFGAAALNRKVEAFAGISLIDKVQSLAQEEHRTKKAAAEALAVDADAVEEAEQRVDAMGEAALAAEAALKAAQEAFEATPDPMALVEPEGDPDAMQRRRDQAARLERELATAQVEAKAAKEKYDDALQRFEEFEVPGNATELEAELAELSTQVKAGAADVDRLQRELTHQEQLWQQLTEAQEVYDDAPEEDGLSAALVHDLDQQAERHDQRRAEQERVVELNHQIRQLQSLQEDANCPTCGTLLSEHDPEKLVTEIEQLIEQRERHARVQDELTRACQSIDAQVVTLQNQLDQAQAAERRVDELRDQLVDLGVDLTTAESPVEAQLAEAKEIHEGLVTRKAALAHRVEQLEADQVRYDRAKRAVNTAEHALKEAKDGLETTQAEYDALTVNLPSEADIEAARRALREYEAEKARRQQALSEARHAVELAQRAFDQAEKDLTQARDALEALRRKRAEAVLIARAADQAARLAKFLRERRAGYLQQVWDAVLAVASKQVAMATKGMVTRLAYDDGDFLFEEEGVMAPIASASGAQKAHSGVALRIGLSRALYGSSALIIFDEPTESMSEHHAQGLSASLAGAASQCLLITHREQDQDLSANVVEVAA